MNRIRFSMYSKNGIFDSDDPKSSYASHENLLSVGSKRKIPKARRRKVGTTSGPDRSDGSESIAIEDCSMVPSTTGIDARPLPLVMPALRLPRCCVCGETLCVSVLTCVRMCACTRVCTCVCVCDPQDCGLGARAKQGKCPPYPQSSTCLL